MALKQFFPKNYKNHPAARGEAPTTPSVARLSYTSLLNAFLNSDIITFYLLVQALSLKQNPGQVPKQATNLNLSFYDIFVSQ